MNKMLSLALALTLSAGSAFAADNTISGYYRGDGKDAKLSFIRVAKGETPYTKVPAFLFALTEKDATGAKDLSEDTIAFSHKYGSAITMTIFKNSDGAYEVEQSSFHHELSDKVGGNASGILQLKDVTETNGVLSGEVYTKPDTDMFGAKLDVDLKFKVAVPK